MAPIKKIYWLFTSTCFCLQNLMYNCQILGHQCKVQIPDLQTMKRFQLCPGLAQKLMQHEQSYIIQVLKFKVVFGHIYLYTHTIINIYTVYTYRVW